MKAHNLHFKTFAVSGGDPTQYWAQGRAKGFRRGIQEAIPGAKFVTTEKNMLNTTYDPAKTYDAYKAFLRGAGKNVDVIENVDIGAGYRGPRDQGRRQGRQGVQRRLERHARAGRRDQERHADRALRPELAAAGGFGALACANFMKTGKVLPNTQQLTVVTKANLASGAGEARQHQDLRAQRARVAEDLDPPGGGPAELPGRPGRPASTLP